MFLAHLAHLAHLRTLQDSAYTYADDQTEVNLIEENQAAVKDEPAKDKWVALTIMHADGSAMPPFLAEPALSVHQLLRQQLLAGALPVADDTKFALRVVWSSPWRCRLLDNMEETLGDVLARERTARPSWAIWPLRSELKLSLTPLRDAGILGRAVRSRGRCVRVWGVRAGFEGLMSLCSLAEVPFSF